MTQTIDTYPIPTFETTSTDFIPPTIHPNYQKLPAKVRNVIAKLEELDIGWLDILTAMANIADQWGEEQVIEVLEATALSVKQNRKISRDF
jgi:hypothetical protein